MAETKGTMDIASLMSRQAPERTTLFVFMAKAHFFPQLFGDRKKNLGSHLDLGLGWSRVGGEASQVSKKDPRQMSKCP